MTRKKHLGPGMNHLLGKHKSKLLPQSKQFILSIEQVKEKRQGMHGNKKKVMEGKDTLSVVVSKEIFINEKCCSVKWAQIVICALHMNQCISDMSFVDCFSESLAQILFMFLHIISYFFNFLRREWDGYLSKVNFDMGRQAIIHTWIMII